MTHIIDFETFDLGTDADGWAVSLRPDGKKEYKKSGITGNFTWPGSGKTWAARTLTSLPIGASSLTDFWLEGAVAGLDDAINASLKYISGSSITAQTSNMYSQSVTASLRYSITLIEK